MSDNKKASDKFPQKMVLPDGTVITAYGVVTTSAPPPIKPIGGRAGLSRKPAPITHKPAVPVDWSFWPASRRVKRDEAIALSLDLDPHTLYSSTDGHINPDFCPDNATAVLFLKRLNLLTACDSRTNIPLSEFAAWAVSNLPSIPPEFEALVSATKSNEARERAVNKVTDAMMARNKPIERVYIIQATATHAPAAPNATEKVGGGDTATKKGAKPKQETDKPWLIADPTDPEPEQDWYIPARYFARQLVKDDSTLLTKRRLLAAKVVQSLTNVKIKKRGGTKPFDPATVLKAFSNVNLG